MGIIYGLQGEYPPQANMEAADMVPPFHRQQSVLGAFQASLFAGVSATFP